jgi:hypothetical protein
MVLITMRRWFLYQKLEPASNLKILSYLVILEMKPDLS